MTTHNQIRSAPVVTTVTPPLADGKRRRASAAGANPNIVCFDELWGYTSRGVGNGATAAALSQTTLGRNAFSLKGET